MKLSLNLMDSKQKTAKTKADRPSVHQRQIPKPKTVMETHRPIATINLAAETVQKMESAP